MIIHEEILECGALLGRKSTNILLAQSFFDKYSLKKLTFSTLYGKKNQSTLEVDTFKVMFLLSYLASLNKTPRT